VVQLDGGLCERANGGVLQLALLPGDGVFQDIVDLLLQDPSELLGDVRGQALGVHVEPDATAIGVREHKLEVIQTCAFEDGLGARGSVTQRHVRREKEEAAVRKVIQRDEDLRVVVADDHQTGRGGGRHFVFSDRRYRGEWVGGRVVLRGRDVEEDMMVRDRVIRTGGHEAG